MCPLGTSNLFIQHDPPGPVRGIAFSIAILAILVLSGCIWANHAEAGQPNTLPALCAVDFGALSDSAGSELSHQAIGYGSAIEKMAEKVTRDAMNLSHKMHVLSESVLRALLHLVNILDTMDSYSKKILGI